MADLSEIAKEQLTREVNKARSKVEQCKTAGLLKAGGARHGAIKEDEACALVLYTALCEDAGTAADLTSKVDQYAFYKSLNALLRGQNARVVAYLPMLMLMARALKQFKPLAPRQVYRGIKGALPKSVVVGSEVTWHAFTSTTTRLQVVEGFLPRKGKRTVFLISTKSGVDISEYSLHPAQDEVLLPAGLRFEVTGECYMGGGAKIVMLQEKDLSPDCILDFDFEPESTQLPPAARRLPAPMPFVQPFRVSRCVGPRPTDRTWRDEWRAAYTEDRVDRPTPKPAPTDESIASGGKDSIEAKLTEKREMVEWKVAQGWEREVAEGVTLLTSYVPKPLGRALMQGRETGVPCTDYAASTHFVCDAFVKVAKALTHAAPPCYRNLTGKKGLAEQFDEWQVLLDPRSGRGTSFVTSAVCTASTSADHFDVAKSGGRAGTFAVADKPQGEQVRWVAQEEADVVEFRSGAGVHERGWCHTLIQTTAYGTYGMPPMTTVEVIEVKAPGTWTAHNVIGANRCFVVNVKYDVDAQ